MSDQGPEPANNFEFAMGLIHRQKQDHGVDLHGKLYSMVQDRVEVFRRVFADEFSLNTNVDYRWGLDNGAPVVAKTQIVRTADDKVIATGHACEFVGSSKFTRYNPIEVAETSAIGRALAAFGLHGGEYASAEEIEYAEDKARMGRHAGPDVDERQMYRPPERDPLGLQGPPERERQFREDRRPPEQEPQPTGFYVPDMGDPAWINPEREHAMVLDQIDRIDNVNDLGAYWGLVRDFIGILSKDNQHLAAEIKAAFATANSTLGGR